MLTQTDKWEKGRGEGMVLGEKGVRMSLGRSLSCQQNAGWFLLKIGMEGPGQRGGFQICCLSEVVTLIMDFMILAKTCTKFLSSSWRMVFNNELFSVWFDSVIQHVDDWVLQHFQRKFRNKRKIFCDTSFCSKQPETAPWSTTTIWNKFHFLELSWSC